MGSTVKAIHIQTLSNIKGKENEQGLQESQKGL